MQRLGGQGSDGQREPRLSKPGSWGAWGSWQVTELGLVLWAVLSVAGAEKACGMHLSLHLVQQGIQAEMSSRPLEIPGAIWGNNTHLSIEIWDLSSSRCWEPRRERLAVRLSRETLH